MINDHHFRPAVDLGPFGTDQELIAGVVDGGQDAFETLYARHAGRILALLVGIMRHRGDAEDVLQETFWHVWSRAGQYQTDRGAPLTWIVQIARSRAADHYRRQHHRQSPPPRQDEAMPSRQEPPAEAVHAEVCGRVQRALEQLPPEQRETITMAFFGGMTHEQISRQQHMALGTVKTRIRLGMRRLRQVLSPAISEVIA